MEMAESNSAKWTRAFINNLPDAAFAIILSGGKKDDEGKTTPRTLRKLPHHGPSVNNGSEKASVDLPHLRNALARLPQSKLTRTEKSKALSHLKIHAKQHGIGEENKNYNEVEKEVYDLIQSLYWFGIIG